MTYKVLDLFSGIGGFSLGLERTGGFKTVAFCEIEEYPQRVLAKHWPDVPCYTDVRTLTYEGLKADGIIPTCITAGFPCQDISNAGRGAGIEGERSGLWSEVARLTGEIRPRYLLLENVSAILGRGLDTVLGDLAQVGYDCEWHCVPASHPCIGALHQRDRWWCVAYANQQGLEGYRGLRERPGEWIARSLSQAQQKTWVPEPDVGRVANGVPNRVDRLKGLGNAVVPQIPELIGQAILEA